MKEREIKFRAWDKRSQGMITGSSIKMMPIMSSHSLSGQALNEGYLLMQYTGIDIDQVSFEHMNPELYEGDVLIKESDASKYVIEFGDGAFYACCIDREDNVLLAELLGVHDMSKCGDIYSNPELLS